MTKLVTDNALVKSRGPRYDWASVDKILNQRWPELSKPQVSGMDPGSVLGLPELLGMRRQMVWASRRRGFMASGLADYVATKLGLHPSLIWPTWFLDAVAEPHCRWCGEPLPLGSITVACCTPHQKRWRREQDKDRYEREVFEQRCDRIRARLDEMSPLEVSAWLGDVDFELYELACRLQTELTPQSMAA